MLSSPVGDKLLENVLNFSYLGSDFQSNGDRSHAMKVRMTQAKERFRIDAHVLLQSCLPGAKLRFHSAVRSSHSADARLRDLEPRREA